MDILISLPRLAAGGTAIDTAHFLIGAATAGCPALRAVHGARWRTTCFTSENQHDGDFAYPA